MSKNATRLALLPRLIRLRDAPDYLGMDRNRFNAEVRPYLTEIPIGKQGIAFDRLELDAWVDQYKSRNGRPASNLQGEQLWDANKSQGYGIVAESGTSKSRFSESRFTKALEQATSKRRN
jgi:predicted DNA-binding transcriptional regulator AlpA